MRHPGEAAVPAPPVPAPHDDVQARLAKDLGAKLVISTDTHSMDELALLRFGVGVARRAWLTRDDVLNTLPADRLLAAFGRVH